MPHAEYCRSPGCDGTRESMRNHHGTPLEFRIAVYKAVGEFISFAEADEAIAKYQRDWDSASESSPPRHSERYVADAPF